MLDSNLKTVYFSSMKNLIKQIINFQFDILVKLFILSIKTQINLCAYKIEFFFILVL